MLSEHKNIIKYNKLVKAGYNSFVSLFWWNCPKHLSYQQSTIKRGRVSNLDRVTNEKNKKYNGNRQEGNGGDRGDAFEMVWTRQNNTQKSMT